MLARTLSAVAPGVDVLKKSKNARTIAQCCTGGCRLHTVTKSHAESAQRAIGGQVLACIPNVQHYSVLVSLLRGQWEYQEEGLLDRTHLRFFTLPGVQDLFARSGLHVFEVIPRWWPDAEFDRFQQVMAPVVRALRSLTDDKPALRPRHAPDAAASTATRPSFVTMANAPLSGTGWARDVQVNRGWGQERISVNRK